MCLSFCVEFFSIDTLDKITRLFSTSTLKHIKLKENGLFLLNWIGTH